MIVSKQQLVSAKAITKKRGKGFLPIKSTDVRLSGPLGTMRYGGYTSAKGAYFFLVEYDLKGERVRSIEPVYVYMMDSIHGKEDLEEYCRKELGYENPSVRQERIPMYSHVRINGFDYYLTGRQDGHRLKVCNAVQITLPVEWFVYIKALSKAVDENWDAFYIERQATRIQNSSKSEETFISKEKNDRLYEELLQKHLNGVYKNRINGIGQLLNDGNDTFRNLPVNEQAQVLLEILKISQNVNSGANLVLLGGSASTGVSVISATISKAKSFLLVNDSVTGIFMRATDLLTV